MKVGRSPGTPTLEFLEDTGPSVKMSLGVANPKVFTMGKIQGSDTLGNDGTHWMKASGKLEVTGWKLSSLKAVVKPFTHFNSEQEREEFWESPSVWETQAGLKKAFGFED